MSLFKINPCLLGWHDWRDTAVNPRCITLEQGCQRCGEFRYRDLRPDLSVEKDWKPGMLPRARILREESKAESDGFQWWGAVQNMEEKRGGPGRGQGRKPVADTPTRHYTVTLDDATVKKARVIGDGNLSKGLRDAVDAYQIAGADNAGVPGQPRKDD